MYKGMLMSSSAKAEHLSAHIGDLKNRLQERDVLLQHIEALKALNRNIEQQTREEMLVRLLSTPRMYVMHCVACEKVVHM